MRAHDSGNYSERMCFLFLLNKCSHSAAAGVPVAESSILVFKVTVQVKKTLLVKPIIVSSSMYDLNNMALNMNPRVEA